MQSYVIQITAERGALPEEVLKKVLRVRGGQVRRLVVTPLDAEQDRSVLQLARVSQADIRVGAARLRELPGVQEVTVDRKRRSM